VKPLLTTWSANAMSLEQVRHLSVLGCVLVRCFSRSFSTLGVRASGIFESACCKRLFALKGLEGKMKCAEGGEESGVAGVEDVGELLREGTDESEGRRDEGVVDAELLWRRRKGNVREGRR
jgi:hypothetical protein